MNKNYFCAKFEAIKGVIKGFEDEVGLDENIGAEKIQEIFETTIMFIKKIIDIK